MHAKVKNDLCKEIRKGDEVEVVPEYLYMIGSNVRIKEYFNLMPGEVVVKKITLSGNKEELSLVKCKKTDLIIT